MTWVDIFEKMIHAIAQLAPTIGVVATGWFGMRASKAGHLNQEQFKELKGELSTIHAIGEDNKQKITEVNEKLIVHDEAHLVTMYLRLERDIHGCSETWNTQVYMNQTLFTKCTRATRRLGGNGTN